MSISHNFFICNKNREPDRYQYIIEQIEELKIEKNTIFHHIWGDEITNEIRELYCKSDVTMQKHGRNMITNPLSNGEISLFLNHVECLKHIRDNYTDGLFTIFESDAILGKSYNERMRLLLEKIIEKKEESFIVVIGQGPYSVVNPDEHNEILKCTENEGFCTGGTIWSHRAICDFLCFFEKEKLIDSPIDTKLVFSNHIFDIYMSIPGISTQGSISGKFKSHMR